MDQFKNYNQYLVYMEQNYDEEQQITIENFISYYINIYRGFGSKNCHETYQDDLINDLNGDLHKFALIGYEFEKKIHDERKLKKLNLNKNVI